MLRRHRALDIEMVSFQSTKAFMDIQGLFLKLMASVKHAGSAIRRATLWLYHAPARCGVLVIHAIGVAIEQIKVIILFAIKVALLCGAGLLTLLIAFLAYKAYKSYQARQDYRNIEDEPAQGSFQIQEAERRRMIHEHRRRQEHQRQEEDRRKHSAEQQRKAEETREEERNRKQDEERRRRLQQALCAQERLEQYNQWMIKCNRFFETESGEIPQPPSWPCSIGRCTEDRQLNACCHNLEWMFRATRKSKKELREERDRWHPNNAIFSRHDKSQPASERMATEITQVLQSLVDE